MTSYKKGAVAPLEPHTKRKDYKETLVSLKRNIMEQRISLLTKLTKNALYAWRNTTEKLDDYKTEYKIATMKAIVLIGVVVCAGTKCIDKTKVNITALFVKEILLVG